MSLQEEVLKTVTLHFSQSLLGTRLRTAETDFAGDNHQLFVHGVFLPTHE